MGLEALAQYRTHQPCAACRMLRRRCDSNCILAPYFPSDEIEKFSGVHKVFGASNVIKMIQVGSNKLHSIFLLLSYFDSPASSLFFSSCQL